MSTAPQREAIGRAARAPRTIPALISVHDLMPETLDAVAGIVGLLDARALRATLLVVPGRNWRPAELDRLRCWAAQGHELAAHGWHHRARAVRGLRHRLHAAVLSRDVAEHLALSTAELRALLRRSHAWFAENGLPAPTTYVPPAWALGPLSRAELRGSPFARVECLSGVIDTASGRLRPLPLVGFEADTTARAAALHAFNRAQATAARVLGQPLRIAIHPQDLQLRLAASLRQWLEQPLAPVAYRKIGSGDFAASKAGRTNLLRPEA